MLQANAVSPELLSLIREIQLISELKPFALAGGTALALKFGHRQSVDIDLFGPGSKTDIDQVILALDEKFGHKVIYDEVPGNWAVFCYINEIKVDIIPYDHPQLSEPEYIEGIRLFSLPDICAMKLAALLGRGTKKDFWDIYELLQLYDIDQMISFYEEKFPRQRLMITIPQALTYFEDAELTPEPISMKSQNWEQIKEFIRGRVRTYLS